MSDLESRGLKVGRDDVSDVNGMGKGIAKSSNKELVRAVPWRVFINHIDSYHASQLADLLATKLYIPTLELANEGKEKKLEGENDGGKEKEEEEKKWNEYKGDSNEMKNRKSKESPRKFELVATAMEREYCCPPGDVRIIPSPENDKGKFLSEILKCGIIIYDITQDKSQIAEANWVLNELVRALDEQQQLQQQCRGSEEVQQEISVCPRSFIVISCVMTWSGSIGVVAESKHWKRRLRRGHPSYRDELQCELNVAAAVGRKRATLALRACVVCAGLTYGEGEALLQYAFKLAWLNDNWLPVVGHGRNLVPLLHVRDLANAVYAVMREWPKTNYVLAVERRPTTQKALITVVSRALSTGKVKSISVEEALAFRDITPRVVDAVTLDLDLRPTYLSECASMEWRSKGTFCNNIDSTVREFLAVRHLQPVKLIILGPPASGKTHLAQALAQHYRLHHLSLNRIIPEMIQQLTDEVKEFEKMINDDDDDEEEEEEEEENLDNEKHKGLDLSQSLLEDIQSSLKENKGRLNDDLLTKVFRRKLLSRECQNQGYVLDGYPKTLEQARLLFGQEDFLESEEKPNEPNPLLPHLVIVLEARDEFLLERLNNRSERDLQNSRNTEQCILQRLQKYRQRNDDGEDDTPLQLFDELEIHPVVLDIEQDDSPHMLSTFHYCLSLLGPTSNYGATDEELEEEKRRAEAEEAARSAMEAARREIERAQLRAERERRACQWMDLLEKLQEEEEERLRITAEPLRHYLARYVFPTLTQALLEVAKLRPNDSIDYLAQYLFKLNPNGRAFEPDYREETSATLETIQQFQDDDVMPLIASSEDNFECPETCVEPETDKCFCNILSHSTLESNSDFSSEDKCNKCG